MGTNRPFAANGQRQQETTKLRDSHAIQQISGLAGLLVWEADPRTRSIHWISGAGIIEDFPLLASLNDYLEINHPEDRDAVRAAFSRWLDNTDNLDIEHRIVLPTGKIIWLHSRGSIRTPGQPHLLGIAQDITDYRQRQVDSGFLESIQETLESNIAVDRILETIRGLVREHLDLSTVAFLDISLADDRVTLLHRKLNDETPFMVPGNERPVSTFIPPEIAAILANGTAVSVPDVATDPRLADRLSAFDSIDLRSAIGIPYIQDGQLTTLLCAGNRTPREWTERERNLLAEVSERVNLHLAQTRANLGLRRSEERFRSLFETMDEGFCVIRMHYDDEGAPDDFTYMTANPAFEQHTGLQYPAGKPASEVAPGLEDHWLDAFGEVDRTREAANFVNSASSLDDRWFDVNAFPVGDATHHQVAVLFTDITERKQTEQSLKDFETRVQRALEIESVGIIFFRPEGQVTYANPAFLRMSGYTEEDVRDGIVRWDTMTPSEWMPSARRAITEFLSFGRITPYEKEYIRKDGTRWWGHFAASRIDGDEGVKFVIDISAMKQAEAERDRLADIVEGSNDAIIRCDPAGEIIDFNHAALDLYGYRHNELLGMNVIDTAPQGRRKEFAEKYARLQCGDHVPPWETERHGKDGRKLQVEIRMSPIRNPRGEIIGCSGIIRDVSERKRLEQAQEDFLAMASHDLKSPVTVLLGRAQLMRRRKSYDESSVRTIIDQARRIEQLATDLQHVVHIESGQLEFHPTRIDLLPLVQDAVNRLQTSARNFEFRSDLPQEPVRGSWDPIRISQVIDNLLGNAVKYSPDGGTITVGVTPGDTDVEIRISDQGVGISPALQQRLFTRFYRADKNGISSGLGLGLYISRMLVEAHGGNIRVESTPGEGSTFTVRLPRDSGAAAQGSEVTVRKE